MNELRYFVCEQQKDPKNIKSLCDWWRKIEDVRSKNNPSEMII